MANSYIQYNAGGRNYAVPFPYISKDHINATVDGTSASFQWVSASVIQLNVAPPTGAVVEVRRTTPNLLPVVDFSDGSVLASNDLDKSNLQNLYLSQEAQDTAENSLRINRVGLWDAGARRVINGADPVAGSDLVTKQWAEAGMSSQLAQATSASASATQAAQDAQAARDAAIGSANGFISGSQISASKLVYPTARKMADRLSSNRAVAGKDFGLDNQAAHLAINQIMAALDDRGGGILELPAGTLFVGSAIDNKYSRVMVVGSGTQSSHDVSGASIGTVLVASADCTGPVDATSPNGRGALLRHRTPYNGPSAPRNTGGGFRDIRVIGNNRCRRLLEVDSITQGDYLDLCLENPVGYDAAWFRSGVTGVDLGEATDVQRARIRIFVRCVEGAGANAHGITLDGSDNANFSLNRDVEFVVQHVNGNALNLANADNNDIHLTAYGVGAGSGLSVAGNAALNGKEVFCRANTLFLSANRGSYFQGLETANSTKPSDMREIIPDAENGTPIPTLGTGVVAPIRNVSISFTPTVTTLSGALGAGVTAFMRYSYAGRKIIGSGQIGTPNNGTGAGLHIVTLPRPMKAGANEGIVTGLEVALTGKAVVGIVSGNALSFRYYDGTYAGADGAQFRFRFEYEI